jgi:hypothetical protein
VDEIDKVSGVAHGQQQPSRRTRDKEVSETAELVEQD